MPKLIIVDDEEDQEELIMQKFANKSYLLGYEFLFAPNGLIALEKIRQHPDIDIALIDINMPEMDGLTLLEKIKEINPILRAVIISAYGDMSNIRVAMNRGAFDFVTKPIDMADLEITIRKTITQVMQLKENAKTIHENLFLKQKATENEMKALRAQMNPHFIYNALNSIQSLVATNQANAANKYISKFAQLLRQVLENSKCTEIPLGQELESLRLYVDLEKLRLDEEVIFTEKMDETIAPETILIPPLILQPFVENALWHGLSTKEGEKRIEIAITEDQGWLHFIITDNGIGRERAASLHKKLTQHESTALQVTNQRLIDFNGTQKPAPLQIEDQFNPDGSPAGTQILLTIRKKSQSGLTVQ